MQVEDNSPTSKNHSFVNYKVVISNQYISLLEIWWVKHVLHLPVFSPPCSSACVCMYIHTFLKEQYCNTPFDFFSSPSFVAWQQTCQAINHSNPLIDITYQYSHSFLRSWQLLDSTKENGDSWWDTPGTEGWRPCNCVGNRHCNSSKLCGSEYLPGLLFPHHKQWA